MREIVIVIADLYLAPGATGAAAAAAAVPGIATLGRFGARTRLVRGWREWLARRVGRTDLADVAPACVAAGVLPSAPDAASEVVTSWIATPVQLIAGLARVDLDPRGILRLPPTELSALATDFGKTFATSDFSLTPLPSGELLLRTPGVAPVETTEPARCTGVGVQQALPRGTEAAPLRRLIAELEMWLHTLPLNESRRLRGQPPVTALWPWGATGRVVRPVRTRNAAAAVAFGRDAWLEGLWSLQGSACGALPQHLAEALDVPWEQCVLVTEGGGELQRSANGTLADALSRLDERFVSPALQALRRGKLGAVTLVANDTQVRVRRHSLLKLWRRPHAGLASFA